jgi:hypothetical protein
MLEDVLLDGCGVFMILLKFSTCFVGVVTSFTENSLPLFPSGGGKDLQLGSEEEKDSFTRIC